MATQFSHFMRPALVLTVLLPGLWLGCGTQPSCHPETWSGTCHLQTVTKVREVELPLPSVVLEAIYRTEAAGHGSFGSDIRREFTALAKHEEALRQHVLSHPAPPCYVSPPPPGQCNPGALVVDVPEFDGTTAEQVAEDAGPRGCAQIDATSTQDRIRARATEAEAIAERFHFAESSAVLPEGAEQLADAIALRMKGEPSIQCVGVVGQYVRGETLEIAFTRARAVRQLLIERGVEPERLTAITLDRPVTGASGGVDPSSPTDRQVSLSVLLKLAPERIK